MSFVLELEVEDLTEEQARAVVEKCGKRGAWPVQFVSGERRVGLFRRTSAPELWLPEEKDGRHLLADDATWDAASWSMDPELLPALAGPVRVLDEELPQGFALRASWVGSDVREERTLAGDELARIVLASAAQRIHRLPRSELARPGPLVVDAAREQDHRDEPRPQFSRDAGRLSVPSRPD